MIAPITITSKPATQLTAAEIADCYSLIAQAGILAPPGMIEAVHLVHNPTVLLAHQQGRLVGFQTYSHYQVHTPFRAQKMPLVYGGLALQHSEAAGQGIAYRLASHYMRELLGPFWPLRDYVVLIGTVNPRLIQLFSRQHQVYLPIDQSLPPAVVAFVKDFIGQKRPMNHPISDELVVSPVLVPATKSPLTAPLTKSEITAQWPRLYRASEERYNQLAYRLKLIEQSEGRHYLVGNGLLVLARSSRRRVIKSSWALTRNWLGKRFKTAKLS